MMLTHDPLVHIARWKIRHGDWHIGDWFFSSQRAVRLLQRDMKFRLFDPWIPQSSPVVKHMINNFTLWNIRSEQNHQRCHSSTLSNPWSTPSNPQIPQNHHFTICYVSGHHPFLISHKLMGVLEESRSIGTLAELFWDRLTPQGTVVRLPYCWKTVGGKGIPVKIGATNHSSWPSSVVGVAGFSEVSGIHSTGDCHR